LSAVGSADIHITVLLLHTIHSDTVTQRHIKCAQNINVLGSACGLSVLVAMCAVGLALPLCFHLYPSLLNVHLQMLQFVTLLINIAKLTAVKLSIDLFIIFVCVPCRSYHVYLCLIYESLQCVVFPVLQLVPLGGSAVAVG
jgi:hypothetical protein